MVSQKLSHLTSQMPVTTKPRTNKRNKKTEEVVVSDSAEEVKPTVTVDATTASESEGVVEEPPSDSDSSASVALPMPSKKSSKASSRRPSTDDQAEEAAALCKECPLDPYLEERLHYIQHLIDTENEEMLERMYRFLQSSPFQMEEQLNIIRSGLAELNRRAILTAQYEWAEERAAARAAAEYAAAEAERIAREEEEERIKEHELAELAKLQAKYKRPMSKCEVATRIFMGTCAIVSIATSMMK